MTESHTGYRIPSSQMDDVPIDNRGDSNAARMRSQYAPSKGKSAQCLNAANHWDFFMRYKITVFTGIVSIVALVFFSAWIIYMTLESADVFDEKKSVTEWKPIKNYGAEEFDRRENTLRRDVYEIIPESLIRVKKRQARKKRKRDTETIMSRKIPDSSKGEIILRRIKTGSTDPLDVDVIPYNTHFMEEIYDNDLEDERSIDKREIERQAKLSGCQRRSEHCKLILDNMLGLIKKTGDNVQNLNELVKKMKLRTDTKENDPKEFQDFLQCVECGRITTNQEVNDRIAFIDDSDGMPAAYEQDSHRGKSSHMKNMKTIAALLDGHSPNWSSYSSSASASTSSEEYRSRLKNTKAGDIQASKNNSVSITEVQKLEPNVQKTVQVSRSKKIENGTIITNVLKNMTIIKTQSDGVSEKETQQAETSTERILNFDSLKPIRQRPTMEISNIPSGTTGPSASNYPSGGQSPSGWSEYTKSEVITEECGDSNANSRTEERNSLGRSNGAGTAGIYESRILADPQLQQSKGDGSSTTLPTAGCRRKSWMSYPTSFYGEPPSGVPIGREVTACTPFRYGYMPTPKFQFTGYPGDCAPNSLRCGDGSHCIHRTLWCDGTVNCPDASDETRCSCRDRISRERICDGYFDCPHGEDELGCFGCPKNTFSCEAWTPRYHRENCISLSQRCDGVPQCPNGKDEKECNILTGSYIEAQDLFTIGYANGFLHKNWQGRWYPVCSVTESWAADACLSESCIDTAEKPLMQVESIPPGTYQGPYIHEAPNGEIQIVPTCFDKAVYVNCPQIPCGTRDVSSQESLSPYDIWEDSIVAGSQNQNNETSRNMFKKVAKEIEKVPKNVENFLTSHSKADNGNRTETVGSESRIVGGKASRPKAWPFLVAIFIDGYFHCGGAIINQEWILTAAHCVDEFQSHYYEITAGLLRRYSFSPTAQIRRAHYITIHPAYEKSIMKNDLALVKLNEPLRFNRWIRPTCLPKSSKSKTYWKNNPLPDTTCVAVGWGATQEHGPNPDHLREVEIPILPECKYPEERNDAEICAGMPRGGRDSCQGDSGGPLLCKYPNTENQWYVAGITSHGWGCARPNEPGAYTKVSKFVDWIDYVTRIRVVIGPRPLQICPGFSCSGGIGKCIPLNKRCDKIVNCLDAEDEMNCQNYQQFPVQNNKQSSVHGSQLVNQVAPDFPNGIEKKNMTKNNKAGNVATSKDSAKNSVFTMDKEENSTTTVRVETGTASSSVTQKNITDATSANGTNSKQPIATASKPQSSSQQSNESNKIVNFACTRITQSIPIGERCNRVIDCEDGTDEDDCSCKDYLANSYPIAICDGHVDCYDGSDEENCTICRRDEFVCSRSGKCISQSKMCDHHTDCPHMEDELDCFALTNGDYIIMDLDKRPHLNIEGVVAQRKHGMWRPACQKHNATVQDRLSNEFCVYFGFRAAKLVKEITVRDSPIDVRESTKDNVIRYEYPPIYEIPEEGAKICRGLYVQCKPVLSANKDNLIVTNSKTENVSYLWPWQSSIFVDGRFHCPAILLEHSWLLASSRCAEDIDLRGNYTMALLGIAPTYRYVDGPYQQMTSIDNITILEKLDAALLHLKYPVNMTRYVQPIFIQKKILPAMKNDYCVATGVDEKHRTKITILQPQPKNCPVCHRCYTNATVEDCRNKTSTNWSGTIVCRGSGLWYPAAIFHEKDLICGFQTVQTLTSIDYGNAHFTEIMDGNVIAKAGPICDGMRCPLGKCVPWNKVCDGKDDCRDGSDEKDDYCEKRKVHCEAYNGIGCKCSKSELRCASGQCVPKEAFCDYKADCDDGSDEPAECTCGNYLKLTAPERLCDDVRHCFDKSDEKDKQCICKDASFKCNRNVNVTETCVSQDFVCDGEKDCANGEDEKTCRRVRGTLKDPSGTGEVLRRSFGVWHSECFPSPTLSPMEITDLCKSMGYDYGKRHKIDNETNVYGTALVPQLDKFYMVRLNSKTWLNIRDPKPLVTLVPAKETCHRAFVKCT